MPPDGSEPCSMYTSLWPCACVTTPSGSRSCASTTGTAVPRWAGSRVAAKPGLAATNDVSVMREARRPVSDAHIRKL